MNMNGYEHSMKMDETAKNGRTLKDLNLTDDFLFDIKLKIWKTVNTLLSYRLE